MADSVTWYTIQNTGTATIPPNSLVFVTGLNADYQLVAGQCASSGASAGVLISGSVSIAPGSLGQAHNQFPCAVAYDPSTGTPAAGDTWGCLAGSWLLSAGQGGFLVLGGADPRSGLVVVMPAAAAAAALAVGYEGPVPGGVVFEEPDVAQLTLYGATGLAAIDDGAGNVFLNLTQATATLLAPVTLATPTLASGGTLVAGQTYYYLVTYNGTMGQSQVSNEVSMTPTSGQQTVALSWSTAAHVITGASGGYTVWRGLSSFYDGATPVIKGTDRGIVASTLSGTTYTDSSSAGGSGGGPILYAVGTSGSYYRPGALQGVGDQLFGLRVLGGLTAAVQLAVFDLYLTPANQSMALTNTALQFNKNGVSGNALSWSGSGTTLTLNGFASIGMPGDGVASAFLATPTAAAGVATLRPIVPGDLPVATLTALGIVGPDGSTLGISAGVLSAATATTASLGVVQPDGSTITIVAGVISATTPGSGPGSGSVSSVALSLPTAFNVSGSPVTASGTLSAAWASVAAHAVLVGPALGAAAAPTQRLLVPGDLPVATGSALGIATVDGSTITISGSGVLSAVANNTTGPSTVVNFPKTSGQITVVNGRITAVV